MTTRVSGYQSRSDNSDEEVKDDDRTDKWEITSQCLPYKGLLAFQTRPLTLATSVDDEIGSDEDEIDDGRMRTVDEDGAKVKREVILGHLKMDEVLFFWGITIRKGATEAQTV